MSAAGIPSEWYFITPPQDVSWNKDSVTKEVDTYGTNNPYLNYGTTKLRKLTLGNAMVEGFSDAKQVEDNVVQLEACMRMIIEEGTGYAAPYCWKAYAGGKSYGTFIITGVNVKEEMRDMAGKATRAIVDINLQEVAPYQVSSGIDITSTATVGGFDPAFEKQMASEQAAQDAKASQAKGSAAKGSPTSSSGSSSSSSSSASSGGSSSAASSTASSSASATTEAIASSQTYELGKAPGQYFGPKA